MPEPAVAERGGAACREGAARMIASVSTSSKIIVEKSTVPVKTAEAIEKVTLLRSVRGKHIVVPCSCVMVHPLI